MSSTIFRINDFSLIKVDKVADVKDFKYALNDINLTQKHYAINPNQILWLSGTYANRLNHNYNGLLYNPIYIENNLQYTSVKLLLPQGFNWTNVYGIHIVIKTINTNIVLISEFFYSFDFTSTNQKELIDGTFWLEEVQCYIPTINEGLQAQINIIKDDEIDMTPENIGYVNKSLDTDLTVLIGEKPTPDFIVNQLELDENQFVNVGIKTTEIGKTVEQSLIDYFSEDSNPIIDINYNITYGNDTYGYKSILVKNTTNLYDNINIGLNLLQFYNSSDPTLKVKILLMTQINVNNKIMTRTTELETDLSELSPFIQNNIEHPTTNYPVTIENVTNISNQIIDVKKSVKVVSVTQPVFIELIHDNFVFESKNIYFQTITKPAQIILNQANNDSEQILTSEITADNVYYFDLSKLNPITTNTTYQIIDIDSKKIIGKGEVSVK